MTSVAPPSRPWPLVRRAATLVLAVTLCGGGAMAQTHRCSGLHGAYLSDRACPIAGGTRLGSIGPAEVDEAPLRAPLVTLERAPEHLGHMSPDCAGLNDAIRTAPARGLSEAMRSELRADYARRCSADEALARQRWELDLLRQRQRREQLQLTALRETEREQAEQQRTVLQCSEMRRIVAGKQARATTLSAGERADLRRFEALVGERCGQSGR